MSFIHTKYARYMNCNIYCVNVIFNAFIPSFFIHLFIIYYIIFFKSRKQKINNWGRVTKKKKNRAVRINQDNP